MNSKQIRPSGEPDFNKGNGVITAIAQDAKTGAVLMVAQMNKEAYDLTVSTGEMHYLSRTRGLWHKGATSGNVQHVESLHLDCDNDAIVALVTPAGPACHTGSYSCFDTAPSTFNGEIHRLSNTIEQRAQTGESSSYTAKLLSDENLRMKKIGEECTELVVALTKHDSTRAVEEAADIFYHTLVALKAEGLSVYDVEDELKRRRKD